VEDTVRYKQFDIIVKAEPEKSSRQKYLVFVQIRPENAEQSTRSWLISEAFPSEQQAFEFGLLQAQKWIDGQPQA
jgi:hypothetical protein